MALQLHHLINADRRLTLFHDNLPTYERQLIHVCS